MFLRLLIFTLFLSVMNVFAQTPPIETGVSQTLAKWRAANYSGVRYKLNLTLEKMSPTLKGTIEISVKNNADQIILDWRKLRGKEDLSSVTNVFVNGKAAKFEEINEHLVFKDGVVKGENVVKLDFISPILTSGGAITRYVDKEDNAEYVYSLFVPSDASTAFPVFDQPDLKARFQLNVVAPYYWKVVSNTDIIPNPHPPITSSRESLPQETKTALQKANFKDAFDFHFKETRPISTYVFAFAAGDFTEFYEANEDNILKQFDNEKRLKGEVDDKGQTFISVEEIRSKNSKIYVRKSQAEKFKQHSAEVYRLNREAVQYLAEYFDYKFPFPKYDLVLIPEFPFGGMEHAGATFLREDRIIFPTEPTKNDFITRANLIFHEAAHQWFGDTVTMRWFDDLWLKEGFAEFMAYKTLEKVMPEYNSWKIFYERNKQAAYLTDSTKGTTPIYQEIPNLSAAKSAYGNIVYRKAPSFLKQAEFYLGADKFQTAVRQFLKKHQFANAEWTDLVREFETASGQDLKDWANVWVTKRGMPKFFLPVNSAPELISQNNIRIFQRSVLQDNTLWREKTKVLIILNDDSTKIVEVNHTDKFTGTLASLNTEYKFVFPNYQDYGYGIFLLDERSRDYVLENIQNEKDDFLRTMMWGSLWDSVREAELAPADYVALVIKNINVETDESTIQTLLGRVSTAMNYYLSDKQREEYAERLENILGEKMLGSKTQGQRLTFYRAYLNIASTEKAATMLKILLEVNNTATPNEIEEIKKDLDENKKQLISFSIPLLRVKDKFDIVTKLFILGDKDAPNLLAELEKTEKGDDAKRYAYAARAAIATKENKAKAWNDFVNNKDLSESWIEAAFVSFNSPRHSELTLPYLEKALAELPNLKRNRKIFFVNGWLAAFIGGQKSEPALQIVNKFLADNPTLDKDLRLKILENADGLERAVKIREKYGK